MPEELKLILYIFVSVSLVGSLMVIIDKYNSIHKFHRISEATLITFGVLGGAFLMFLTMKLVHHKTRKPKFMISFPIFTILHIVSFFLYYGTL